LYHQVKKTPTVLSLTLFGAKAETKASKGATAAAAAKPAGTSQNR
jgi:hypothetical protein